MLAEFPYVDALRNPPDPYSSYRFDEVEELNAIDVTNGLDFYQEVVRVISKMQDIHHTFVPPFLSAFYFGIPYGIDSVPDSTGFDRRFKFISCSWTTSFRSKNPGVEDVRGLYITGMDFNGGTNLRPPIDVLSELAENIYLEAWNHHGQFGRLVKCLSCFCACYCDWIYRWWSWWDLDI
jgi:hypothetical protein